MRGLREAIDCLSLPEEHVRVEEKACPLSTNSSAASRSWIEANGSMDGLIQMDGLMLWLVVLVVLVVLVLEGINKYNSHIKRFNNQIESMYWCIDNVSFALALVLALVFIFILVLVTLLLD